MTLEEAQYIFNLPRYLVAFKAFKYDPKYENPVEEVEHRDANGTISIVDTITMEKTIYILGTLDPEYGKDELVTDSIYTTYFNDEGSIEYHWRPAHANEHVRTFAGMRLYSEYCGNHVVTMVVDKPATGSKIVNTDITSNTPSTNGLDARVDGNSNASFTIDTLNHSFVFNFQNIGGNATATATGNSVTVNGTDAGDGSNEGSFSKTTVQDVTNHGIQGNLPYGAQYYSYCEPGWSTPQYCYCSGGQWYYAAGGLITGYLLGWLQSSCLYCDNHGYQSCGWSSNGSGGINIVNNNYNTVTTTSGNGTPNPTPNPTGGPYNPPNGNGTTATTGAAQNSSNRSTGGRQLLASGSTTGVSYGTATVAAPQASVGYGTRPTVTTTTAVPAMTATRSSVNLGRPR